MKISIVIFTYGKHRAMLEKNLAAIQRLRADGDHEIIVNVFEDAAAPLDAPPPGIDVLESTSWPRGISLNTYDCVLGQLDCFKRVAARDKPDWILKVDSDVILNHLAWIPAEKNVAMHGCTIFPGVNFVCGMAYLINPAEIDSLIEVANRPGIRERAEGGVNQAEDRLISAFARSGRGAHAVYNQSNASDFPLAGCMWWLRAEKPFADYLTSAFVTFKRGDNEPSTIIEAEEGMAAYWELLKTQPVYRMAKETPPAALPDGVITLSKEKVCALVDRLGKTAVFFAWLQSSASIYNEWQKLEVLPFDPTAHNEILESLLGALGITAEEASPLIEELRV